MLQNFVSAPVFSEDLTWTSFTATYALVELGFATYKGVWALTQWVGATSLMRGASVNSELFDSLVEKLTVSDFV